MSVTPRPAVPFPLSSSARVLAGAIEPADPRSVAAFLEPFRVEHHCIDAAMARLAAIAATQELPVRAMRDGADEVLDDLVRHGQHDADLVYDAHTTDIGGE